MIPTRIVGIIGGLLLTGLSVAEHPVAALKGTTLNEIFAQEAAVSGRVIAGVVIPTSEVGSAVFLVPAVTVAAEEVCVRVVSKDGLYWSENTFLWPAETSAPVVQLQYDSRYRNELAAYAPEELAILSTEGDCTELSANAVIATARAPFGNQAASLDIYVNSGRSDTFIAFAATSAGRTTLSCELIREGRRTGYDTICRLPLAEVTAGEEGLQVRILRRRYDRMLPPSVLTLKLPGK